MVADLARAKNVAVLAMVVVVAVIGEEKFGCCVGGRLGIELLVKAAVTVLVVASWHLKKQCKQLVQWQWRAVA